MGLDDGFLPVPDAGTFRLGCPTPTPTPTPAPAPPAAAGRDAASALAAEATAARAAEREAARQTSLELPDDVAAVLAGALELAGVNPLDGSPATQAPVLLARIRGLSQLQNVIEAAVAQTVRAAECARPRSSTGTRRSKGGCRGT